MMPSDLSPLWISLATTLLATCCTFFLGLLVAWKLYAIESRWRVWADGLMTLPLVLPPTVVGFLLLLLLGRHSYVGDLLQTLSIRIVFTWPATVIAATVVAFPLMYRTTVAAFEQVNPSYIHAARTLGASEARIFLRILLPLALPGVVAGTVLAFARAMGEFGATLMLAGNIPGLTQTMPIAIFSSVEGGSLGDAYLWVVIMVVLSMALMRLLHLPGHGAGRKQTEAYAYAEAEPPSLISTRVATITDEQIERSVLEVDVERQLAAFPLKVQFRTKTGAVGLLGSSGAGKSMTLRMVAGIEKVDRGRICLNGRVLCDTEKRVWVQPSQRRIGVVFQDYALFPHLTVEKNIAFGLRSISKPQRKKRIAELADQLRIRDLLYRKPTQLSGGQRQRVAIARCLATEPDALLFDEPFAALDPYLRRKTEEHLRSTLHSYKGAVLFVTHDMEEAFRFCSHLMVIEQGKILVSGEKRSLFEQPRKSLAARLTGCKNIEAAELVDDRHLQVKAWKCVLTTHDRIQTSMQKVGYRSHQLRWQQKAAGENVFLCWLIDLNEAPHELTLYLHLHEKPEPDSRAHLQADISREMWMELKDQPQPWRVQLVPERLLLLDSI